MENPKTYDPQTKAQEHTACPISAKFCKFASKFKLLHRGCFLLSPLTHSVSGEEAHVAFERMTSRWGTLIALIFQSNVSR